jgi:hypothetical protein
MESYVNKNKNNNNSMESIEEILARSLQKEKVIAYSTTSSVPK